MVTKFTMAKVVTVDRFYKNHWYQDNCVCISINYYDCTKDLTVAISEIPEKVPCCYADNVLPWLPAYF